MSLRQRLGLIGDALGSFIWSPRAGAHQLGLFAQRVRAYEYSQRWAARTPDFAPVEASNSAPNPLRRHFDAVKEGPGIWKWLHYFEIYHRHLQKFVGRPVTVVEVGVYSGGSLPMWRTYFGPQCTIHGIDIQDACRVYASDATRTTIHIGDQASREFWANFRRQVPSVDVLIDDGGHTPHQQAVTLEEMLPHLRPGGVYICEDIGRQFAAYAQAFSSGLFEYRDLPGANMGSESTPLQAEIDSLHLYPYVVVIEKRNAALKRLECEKHGTQWQPFPG